MTFSESAPRKHKHLLVQWMRHVPVSSEDHLHGLRLANCPDKPLCATHSWNDSKLNLWLHHHNRRAFVASPKEHVLQAEDTTGCMHADCKCCFQQPRLSPNSHTVYASCMSLGCWQTGRPSLVDCIDADVPQREFCTGCACCLLCTSLHVMCYSSQGHSCMPEFDGATAN